jgi:hypothetical protein
MNTILLATLIAKLQEVEAQNPGVECAIDDHEWGVGIPNVELTKVHKELEFDALTPISEQEYQGALKGIEDYKNTNPEVEWNSWSQEVRDDYWYGENKGTFECFMENREMVYKYNTETVAKYLGAKTIVTLRMK